MNILSIELRPLQDGTAWSWGKTSTPIWEYIKMQGHEVVRTSAEGFFGKHAKEKLNNADVVLYQNTDLIKQDYFIPEKSVIRLGSVQRWNVAALKQCKAVIATNQALYDSIKAVNGEITVIPNGLDLDKWGVLPDIEGFTVGFSAHASQKGKGLELVQEAVKKAGGRLKTAIYPDTFIPYESMRAEFYGKINVLVSASANEGCNNCIMEALACGIPVILTKTGYHGDLLTNGRNCLFTQRSDNDIARCITLLKNDVKLRDTLSAGGRVFAEEHHNHKTVAERYVKVLDKAKSNMQKTHIPKEIKEVAPIPEQEKPYREEVAKFEGGYGYLTVAFGENYLKATKDCIDSILKLSKYKLCIITNVENYKEFLPDTDRVLINYLPIPNETNRIYRTNALWLTPFDRTLLIDADMKLDSPDADKLFDVLDDHDLGIKLYQRNMDGSHPEWSWYKPLVKACGGTMPVDVYQPVMVFDNRPFAWRFFRLWNTYLYHTVFNRLPKAGRDMPPLAVTMQKLKGQGKIYEMPPETVEWKRTKGSEKGRLFIHYGPHGTAGDWNTTINKHKPFDKQLIKLNDRDWGRVNDRVKQHDGHIIDVGCLGWDWSQWFIGRKPLIGIDPIETTVPAGVKLYNALLGTISAGQVKIQTSPHYKKKTSSIFDRLGSVKTEVETSIITLDEIIKENNITDISVLKLNVEGAEYQLLLSWGARHFSMIDQIAVAFHDSSRIKESPYTPKYTQMVIDYLAEWYSYIIIDQIWNWYLFTNRKNDNVDV